MYVILALAALAVLGPLFGRDTRDGLDWARDTFWLPRRTAPTASGASNISDAPNTPNAQATPVRSSDSPAPGASGHASADARRSVPAGA